jgi:membrane-bound lytic murein transglycosylase B
MSTLGRVGCAAVAVLGVMYLSDHGLGLGAAGAISTEPIPGDYLALYKKAASTCPYLDWALLAGVGEVETNHGRSPLRGTLSGSNAAGAMGPMQFLGGTFASVRGAHPDVGPNIYSPGDAIPAAAHYLCDSGVAKGNITTGLWAYNQSSQYAADVLAAADRCRVNPANR